MPYILIAIYSHVAPFLTDWQQGFVKSRSCATQLVLTHHQWTKALEDGLQVHVVFLDFAKAFDKVLHIILLQKLCNFWVFAKMVWGLLDRKRTKGSHRGSDFHMVCHSFRCTQDSLLGSLFFVIFITIYLMYLCLGTQQHYKKSRVINCPSD